MRRGGGERRDRKWSRRKEKSRVGGEGRGREEVGRGGVEREGRDENLLTPERGGVG